jgi:hypothetical protein
MTPFAAAEKGGKLALFGTLGEKNPAIPCVPSCLQRTGSLATATSINKHDSCFYQREPILTEKQWYRVPLFFFCKTSKILKLQLAAWRVVALIIIVW